MGEAFERWAVVEGLPVNKGSKKEYLNARRVLRGGRGKLVRKRRLV